MLDEIKNKVYNANLQLNKQNLVILTWGNVSERIGNLIIIKPSGVPYHTMTSNDMVILDLDGNIINGELKPSSDTPTHLELYKAFPKIKGICHTHSSFATSFAQAGRSIACYGTTHADYFNGTIPCTRHLTKKEIENFYEINTGKIIVETFADKDYTSIPGVLVRSHGVFSWGLSADNAIENAIVIEELAKMNYQTLLLNKSTTSISDDLLNKHYYRKHGVNSYYGQQK